MKPVIFLISILFTSPLIAAEPVAAVIGDDFWMSPRHGETLIKSESLARVVQAYLDAAGEARLRIHYPATETGELWGGELQAWLVSLGIASDAIDVRAGYAREDAVELSLTTAVPADVHRKNNMGSGHEP